MQNFYDELMLLLNSEDFFELVPDGLCVSQPIPRNINGDIVDCFFVSSKSDNELTPAYKFGISFNKKELVFFNKYAKSNSQEKGSNNAIGLDLDDFDLYKNLYSNVRGMYKGEAATDKVVILNYIKLFFRIISPSLLPYYNDLSPEFFQFLNEAVKQT